MDKCLTSDNALKEIKEDKLSRVKFAQDISDILFDLCNKEKESIVLGLYGKWGSGKSSILNFIKEIIQNATKLPEQSFLAKLNKFENNFAFINWLKNKQRTFVLIAEMVIKLFLIFLIFNFSLNNFLLSFKPIQSLLIIFNSASPDWLNSYKLFTALCWFFKIILLGYIIILPVLKFFIPLKLFLIPIKKLYNLWVSSTYKKYKVNKPIIIDFKPWNICSEQLFLKQFFKLLSNAIDTSIENEYLQNIPKLLQKYSNLLCEDLTKNIDLLLYNPNKLEISDELTQVKEKLEQELKKQSHTIFIFIDEIDRLTDKEIYLTMQLVNSVANLPNIVYFLSLDREVVTNALNRFNGINGSEFLEKIIQVSFETPMADPKKLEKLLFEKLDEFLDCLPNFTEDFDKKYKPYWTEVYFGGFKNFFKNTRDIIRFTNTLKIIFSPKLQKEVHPIDFMVITAIQLFIPNLFAFIIDNEDYFIRQHKENEVSEFKKNLDRLLEEIKQNANSKILELLKIIFPMLRAVYGGHSYGTSFYEDWRKEGKICSAENFSKFFMYDIPSGTILLSELKQIIETSSNADLFAQELLKINDNGEIKLFLSRLEDYTSDDIPIENIENIISVLFDIGDFFPLGDDGFFSFDIYVNISRITYQLMKRDFPKDEKFNIIKNAITKVQRSIHPAINYVSNIKRSLEKEDDFSALDFATEEQFKELLAITLEKLYQWQENDLNKIENSTWAFNGSLLKHHKFLWLLHFWEQYGDKEKLSTYIKTISKNEEGLITVLKGLAGKITSQTGYSTYTRYEINKDVLPRFFNLDELKSRLNKISENIKNYGETEQQAIQSAIKIINGEQQED